MAASRFLAGLIPPWGWIGLVTVALAAGGAWCHRAGAASVQARWDAADLQRERQDNADAMRRAEQAFSASTGYELGKAATAADLRKGRGAISSSLRTQLSCSPGNELGAVVVPAAALAGVRDAAGAGDKPAH